MKIKEIQKLLPKLNLVSCRNKYMKGNNDKWGNKLILIPAAEIDRQALIKLSVQFEIEPILDVGTRIKIEEVSSVQSHNLCLKQILFKEGCPHANTNNVCIGNKLHLKKGIAEALCNFINEGEDLPNFVERETYHYLLMTVQKLERPKYLKANNKYAENRYKNAVLGTTKINTLFSARNLDKKLKVLNILAHNEAEAKIEILKNLNARPEALDGIKKIEINGEIINYNKNEKSGIVLFKSREDKLMFKKLISILNTMDIKFEEFKFEAKESELAKIEKARKPKSDIESRMDMLENRLNKLDRTVENRLNKIDLTLSNKFDLLLKQLGNKNE